MSAPRLSQTTLRLAQIPAPLYEPRSLRAGIVHLGPGAFHRAHQASFFDAMCMRDPSWGVHWILPHSTRLIEALHPQDHLYTLAILDHKCAYKIIGCAIETTPMRSAAALDALAAPHVFAATLTITEKGYCLAPDNTLDFEHPDIHHDLAYVGAPRSAIGWLVEAISRRKDATGAPLDVLSCDNLSENGRVLREATLAFAARRDRGLADWIAGNVTFPCSMVDSITPATSLELIRDVQEMSGLEDAWPVQRESHAAWVIENTASASVQRLTEVGVTFTGDISLYERAKLRLLNGAHSTLAYLGAARGAHTVYDAMADSELACFVSAMMREEIAPSLKAAAEFDLSAYQAEILARFSNPAIKHELSQIAWDGSRKLPIRIGETISENLAAGRPIHRLATCLAGWIRFVLARTRSGDLIIDPSAERLAALARAPGDNATCDLAPFLAELGPWAERPRVRAAVETAFHTLGDGALPHLPTREKVT